MEYNLSPERLEGTQLSSLKGSRAANLALQPMVFHGGCLVPDDAMKFLRHDHFHLVLCWLIIGSHRSRATHRKNFCHPIGEPCTHGSFTLFIP